MAKRCREAQQPHGWRPRDEAGPYGRTGHETVAGLVFVRLRQSDEAPEAIGFFAAVAWFSLFNRRSVPLEDAIARGR